MSDYIRREAAIAETRKPRLTDAELRRRLASIPAADVVEVVRCADCQHSMMYKFQFSYEKVLACKDPHGVTIRSVEPMHFCGYGKRKEGEA